ncbi:large ribosomal subunit protein mL64 [Pelobates fuscus]|uniref:large ribosomal subunit protein mL64 n=1 Tax=Pelobates fuscus TaxID=191477 RepID=UPI002FE453B6
MAAPISRCCAHWRSLTLSFPAAGYHARPRVWGLGGVYKPDPQDPRTKEWHKGPQYEAKLYGRHGAASGVDPSKLWPSPQRLREIEEDEKEWYPSLQEMLDRVEAKERELQKKKEERDRIIAANLAKMPQMVADWRREKRELKQKQQDEKDRRERLLAQAREKFGLNVDYRSPKFQEMVKELEKQEKKRRKLLKKEQREEALATSPAAGGVTSNTPVEGATSANTPKGGAVTASNPTDGTL